MVHGVGPPVGVGGTCRLCVETGDKGGEGRHLLEPGARRRKIRCGLHSQKYERPRVPVSSAGAFRSL